tara:strand:- start:132 stop:395 length:264 start_codon:yes stop_codon:yes gene_type:complete
MTELTKLEQLQKKADTKANYDAALTAWKEAKQDLRESKMMDELEQLQKNVKDAEDAYAESNAAPYAYALMSKARRDLSDYLTEQDND